MLTTKQTTDELKPNKHTIEINGATLLTYLIISIYTLNILPLL